MVDELALEEEFIIVCIANENSKEKEIRKEIFKAKQKEFVMRENSGLRLNEIREGRENEHLN